MELAVTSTQIQYKIHFPSLGSALQITFTTLVISLQNTLELAQQNTLDRAAPCFS